MDLLSRLSLYSFSIVVALSLLLASGWNRDRSNKDDLLYILMLAGTIAELTLGEIAILLDGHAGLLWRILSQFVNTLYYINHPVVPLIYCFYLVLQPKRSSREKHRWAPVLAFPAVVSGLLSLVNLGTGIFFNLDAENRYSHGSWFGLFALLTGFYGFFVFGFLFLRRREIPWKRAVALLCFPLAPAFGGVIQMMRPEVALTWPSMTLALLVLFLTVQQRKLTVDYLTGTNNRRRLDEVLEARVRESKEGRKPLAAFLADVDDFKQINDRLGHAVGDQALIRTVKVLQSGMRNEDFLARYAGDEFVALFHEADEQELGKIVSRVQNLFTAANAKESPGYSLSLSLGADVFRPETDRNADAFMRRLDHLMYEQKEAKKRLKPST